MTSFNDLVNHIDQPGIDSDPSRDISLLKSDITYEEALAVQLAVKRRRVAEGDRIAGHQASFTSAAIRKMFPTAPRPMIGTLLTSLLRADGDEVELDCDEVFIESEIGVILARDLEGPGLTPSEVLSAIDGFVPAIEVAPLRPGVLEQKYSYAHMIAVQKAKGGYVVLGPRIASPRGIDPRLEACLVSIDGEARAAAAGFEAMGNPLTVISAIAEGLSKVGEKLHAGQVIITGSLPAPQRISGKNRVAKVEFGTIGSVSVRIKGAEGAQHQLNVN